MDISATRHLGHRRCVLGSGEDALEIFFASYFLWKDKTPLTHSRSSKYNADQEIMTGAPEYSETRKFKISKLSAGKRRTNSVRDRGRRIIQC